MCSSWDIHRPQFTIHECCHVELPESCVDEDGNDLDATADERSAVEAKGLVVELPKKKLKSSEESSIHSVTLIIRSFNTPDEEVTYDLCSTSAKSPHELPGGNSVISYHGNLSEAQQPLPRKRYSSENWSLR